MNATGRLEGKTAIVVGAGRGIGRSCAQRLAEEGAQVVVVDIDGGNATAVADSIEAGGGQAIGVAVDVSSEDSIVALVRACLDEYGQIDILHNNAADTRPEILGRDVDVLNMTTELWDRTMAVNVRGPMLTCKHVLPHMIEAGGGSIINTTSASGLTGDLVRAAYGASKAALNSLTWTIATMHGKQGIRCNAIAPGLILSERHQNADPAATALALSHHLTPRVGMPQDIAGAVAFLASDDAVFITGHILRVDGGLLVHMPMVAQQRE